MRQRPIAIVCILTILGLAIMGLISGSPPVSGMRQQLPTVAATPLASPDLGKLIAPYPAGVTLTALAVAPLDETPSNPAALRLERYDMITGETLAGATDGPRLIVIEAGALNLTSDGLPSGSYRAGGAVLVPAAVAAELTPAGDGATFLQLRIEAAGAADAGLRLEAAAAPAVLLSGPARLPRGEATVAIIGLTIEPGVDAGQRVFSGPMGVAIEAGSLSVVDLEGQATRVEPGSGLIAPAYTAHQIRNDGPDPVTAIAVGVLPASPGLAGAPLATPTPAPDPAATATVAALIQSAADLRATVTARQGDADALIATMAAQDRAAANAISAAQATTAAIAVDAVEISANLATSSARSFQAEATATSLRTTIIAGEADIASANAREVSLQATAAALAASLAAQQTDLAALATQTSGASALAASEGTAAAAAEATIAAQAIAMQTVAATATSSALQARAAQGTLEAGLAAAEGTLTAQAPLVAGLTEAQSTVSAQASAIAAVESAPPPSIDANFKLITIDQELFNLTEDPNLRDNVVADVRQQLQSEIDRGCTAGLVLTFGHIPEGNVTLGIQLAGAVNALLATEIPEVFENAVPEDFVSFAPPFGSAEVRVYFTSDCATASIPAVAAPTSPPIVPTQ